MATTFRGIILYPAAILGMAALAACGGGGDAGAGNGTAGGPAANPAAPTEAAATSRLFPNNFKGVCSGASVSTAAAYDPQAASHKALYFATYRDDFMDQSSSLPRDWTVLFSTERDALREIDLVVCARRTAAREVRICDGYRNNGQPTRNRVRWHTATYELSVREARTGRELARTTAEATRSECPMFQTFSGESDTVDAYASLPDATVADFVRPHITRQPAP